MGSPELKITTLDIVNIAIGLIAWVFPDVKILIKILVVFILIIIIIFAHKKPSVELISSGISYLITIISILFVGILSYLPLIFIIPDQCVIGAFSQPTTLPVMIQNGVVYGVLVGMPIIIFTNLFLSKISDKRSIILYLLLGFIYSILFWLGIAIIEYFILYVWDVWFTFSEGFVGVFGPFFYYQFCNPEYDANLLCFVYSVLQILPFPILAYYVRVIRNRKNSDSAIH